VEVPSASTQTRALVVVRVWLAQMHEVDERTMLLYHSWLSPDERERYQTFLHERRRREYVVGRALARRSLAEQLRCSPAEIGFDILEQGRLALKGPRASERVHFNITHTADYVGCATCRESQVGIDIEKLDAKVDTLQIAKRFFSAAEATRLDSLDEPARLHEFFSLWTVKESLAKAHGLGLAAPLESSTIRIDSRQCIDAETGYPPFSAGAWLACCSPTPQHRLAICVLCDETQSVSIQPQPRENSGDLSAAGLEWATGRLRAS